MDSGSEEKGWMAMGLFLVFLFAACGALLTCVGALALRVWGVRVMGATLTSSSLTGAVLLMIALVCRLTAWIQGYREHRDEDGA